MNWKVIILWAIAVIVNLAIYILLSLMTMRYDDLYNGRPEDYGNWNTFSDYDKAISLAVLLWNVVNVIFIAMMVVKWYNKRRRRLTI